jgi:ethanolamine utilization cobalamin adenosyltransferase
MEKMGKMEKQEVRKQEHTTRLSSEAIVVKTNPRIELRGRLDSLNAALMRLQILGQKEGHPALVEELEEVQAKIYDIFACEVTGKLCDELFLWGLDSEELHERSHNPEKYFGMGHIRLHYTMGVLAAGINELRTRAREAELAACRAFETDEGPERPDIVKVLNRLSSALYVLMYRYLPEGYKETQHFSTRVAAR